MTASLQPVAIRGLGDVSYATILWRYGGRLHVSAVVKATFALTAGAVMGRVAPDEVYDIDVHNDDDPRMSLYAASDLAPYRAKADVVVTGDVYAQPHAGSTRVEARVVVLRDRRVLINKAVRVLGETPGAASPAEPVVRIPLAYERAFGGPGWDENPIGTGLIQGSASPSFIDPEGRLRTVAFGPIPSTWPARRRLIGDELRRSIHRPVPEVPSDFDWTYFQTAPPDQRADFLSGSELLVLAQLHPTHAELRTQLPGARAIGKLYGLPGEAVGRGLLFNADNLHIDTRRGVCSITWRIAVPIPERTDPAALRIVVGVETAGQPVTLPAAELRQSGWPETVTLDPGAAGLTGRGLPFEPILSGDGPKAVQRVAEERPPAGEPRTSSAESAQRFEEIRTLDGVTAALGAGLIAPFAIASSGSAVSGTGATIPGAPWSSVPGGGPLQPAAFDGTTLFLEPPAPPSPRSASPTGDFDEPTQIREMGSAPAASPATPAAPPAAPATPPAAPVAPPSSPSERPPAGAAEPEPVREPPSSTPASPQPPAGEAPSWSWSSSDPSPTEPLKPPRAPHAPPAPDVTRGLYERFASKKKR